ncbi:Liver carboxylesterase 1, partial [Lemmus lemmus]
ARESLTTPVNTSSVSSCQVLSPLAKNLFHRAISESGVALTPGMVRKDVKPVAEQVAIAAGCKTTTSAVMVNCLRQKTEDELLEITLKLKPFKVNLLEDLRESWPFLPTTIDGEVLPKSLEEILAEKNFNTVPYMVGINKQEFGWLLPLIMGYPLSAGKLDQKTATSLLRKSSPFLNVPEDVIPAAIKEYLEEAEDLIKNRDLFVDLIGDVLFAVPSVIVARHHRDARAPVYMYEFQYHPSFSSDLKPEMVMEDHGDELFSVFGAPFTKGGASSEEINMSNMVMKFWDNFARNGNPNGKTLPTWPEYNKKEGSLKIGATTQAAQGLKDKEVAFWTKVWTKEAVEKSLQEKN